MIINVSTKFIHKMLYHVPQKFIRVSPVKKTETLLELIEKDVAKKKRTLIFSNKSSTSDFVQMFLEEHNIPVVNFNGNQAGNYRREKLDSFMSGKVIFTTVGKFNNVELYFFTGQYYVMHRLDIQRH